MIARTAWILLLSGLLALPAAAGDSLSIRLVEASSESKGDSSGIEDVIDLLKDTVSAQGYTLVARTSVSLPASNASKGLGGYTVTCSGKADKLAIVVNSDKRELLNTTVRLKKGSPVVLVLYKHKKSAKVLVFNVE